MWIKKTNLEAIQGKIATKDVYIAELEAIVLELRKWVSTQKQDREGEVDNISKSIMTNVHQIELILSAAPRIGRSRQRSVAVRYDGSNVGRRRNTDV